MKAIATAAAALATLAFAPGMVPPGTAYHVDAAKGDDANPGTSPESTEVVRLPGLRQPVEVLVDRWGVPHIFAENESDLFFAQGFNAARDRLFQLDLWRRRGLGQLAEVLGPRYVEQDRAARLYLYRGDMEREWRAYSSKNTMDAARIARKFAAAYSEEESAWKSSSCLHENMRQCLPPV